MTVKTRSIEALDSGDRLSREEFHRRYEARPDIKKAELVEGVVYVSSPLSRYHSGPDTGMIGWLFTFALRHPELRVDNNITVFLDAKTEVQPDACLWREVPGGPLYNDEGYVGGAPQHVVEVAASSASYDLHDKLRAYLRNGVLEYIVWRVFDRTIDWFRLRAGQYVRIEPDEHGIIESETFPGLRLNVGKMIDGDYAGVVAELERSSAT